MTYTKKQLPKYCRHKPSGRAFVRIGGKMNYLGKYGSQASRREYDRIIAEFVANGRKVVGDPDDLLVEDLIAQFLDYINREVDYIADTRNRINRVLRPLNDLYGQSACFSVQPDGVEGAATAVG